MSLAYWREEVLVGEKSLKMWFYDADLIMWSNVIMWYDDMIFCISWQDPGLPHHLYLLFPFDELTFRALLSTSTYIYRAAQQCWLQNFSLREWGSTNLSGLRWRKELKFTCIVIWKKIEVTSFTPIKAEGATNNPCLWPICSPLHHYLRVTICLRWYMICSFRNFTKHEFLLHIILLQYPDTQLLLYHPLSFTYIHTYTHTPFAYKLIVYTSIIFCFPFFKKVILKLGFHYDPKKIFFQRTYIKFVVYR